VKGGIGKGEEINKTDRGVGGGEEGLGAQEREIKLLLVGNQKESFTHHFLCRMRGEEPTGAGGSARRRLSEGVPSRMNATLSWVRHNALLLSRCGVVGVFSYLLQLTGCRRDCRSNMDPGPYIDTRHMRRQENRVWSSFLSAA